MPSIQTKELHLHSLPPAAKKVHVFQDIKKNLLSVPVLCDADCICTFAKTKFSVTKDNKSIMEGPRDKSTNLWNVSLPTANATIPPVHNPLAFMVSEPTPELTRPRVFPAAYSAYQQRSAAELQAYHHASLCAPTVATLINAIKNLRLTTFPGLTVDGVRRHLPKSIQTAMGHMHRHRQGIRSTKPISIDDLMDEKYEDDIELEPPRPNINRQHYVGIEIVKFADLTGVMSTDQSGRFPITSRRGNAYIMVSYDYDSNVIDATAIRSREDAALIEGYTELYSHLTKAGITPLLHKLDNEASKQLIEAIERNDCDYQLAPAYDHRTNSAERAWQTLKNHFLSTLYGVDPDFPKNQWDRLLPQAVMTLNMMRPSRINPRISAYNQVWGNFDYNRTPLAPPGCKAVIHEAPDKRASFAYHGTIGFYIMPAMQHYRCYHIYIPETNGVRTGSTVSFFPKHVQMPTTSSKDRLAATLEDLSAILKHPHDNTPFLEQGTPTNDAIRKLTEIFHPPKRDAAASPRVVDPVRPPRVERRTVPRVSDKKDELKQHPIGSIVRKKFGKSIHRGEITKYDNERKFYWIDYDNGDSEEMTHRQVDRYKCLDLQPDRIKRFT